MLGRATIEQPESPLIRQKEGKTRYNGNSYHLYEKEVNVYA
jgi:hypothetical protein